MRPVCSRHRGAAAGWTCTQCQLLLCPDCVEPRAMIGTDDAAICVHCSALARELTVPKKIEPYWVMWPVFLKNMVSPSGLLQLLAVGLMAYLCGLVPGNFGIALKAYIYASYFFQVLNRAAHGEEGLPLPADFLGYESFAVSARYAFGTLLVWAPPLIYALRDVSWWELANNLHYVLRERLFDPTVFLLFAAGIFYYPAAIIAGAVAESLLAMIAPWITLAFISRIPGQYFLTVIVCAVLSVLDFAITALLNAIEAALFIPIFLPIAVETLKLPVRLLLAFVLGRLVYQNAEQFGMLPQGKLEDPVLPGAKPRGKRATR